MAKSKKVGDLQISEDMEFQRRSWIVQRTGWAIFALVILLAALGVSGDGMLSSARAGQEDGGLWLEFPRFGRFELVDGNAITYVFKSNGNTRFTAHFYALPRRAGPLTGTFRLENGESVAFSQFIYP